MAGISIWVSIGCLCVAMFAAIKFLLGQRKDALTNREVRLFQVLVIVWLFLLVGHSAALFAAHRSPLFAAAPSATALMWWTLVNMLFTGLLSTHYPALPTKTLRELLWCAIAVCGVILVTWPLALGVAAIPVTLPVDLTLGMSAVIAIILGVISLSTPWKVPRAKGGKSSAKRENVQ